MFNTWQFIDILTYYVDAVNVSKNMSILLNIIDTFKTADKVKGQAASTDPKVKTQVELDPGALMRALSIKQDYHDSYSKLAGMISAINISQ